MIIDGTTMKPFKTPTLKEQALEHWRENLRLVKGMGWRVWKAYAYEARIQAVLHYHTEGYPCINGSACPYCMHYPESCYVTKDDMTRDRCPLYDTDVDRGNCCKEWQDVRNALIHPATKKATIESVQRMIKRLEAINE